MVKEDKRLNEVIRVQKRPNNFVMIDKGFLENPNLSWKAKGVLAYLLSKPDNWKVITRDLVNRSTDGKSAVYSGLKELKEYGYYQKIPIRDDKGIFERWESTVYECPTESLINTLFSPLTDFPEMDKPKMENPDMENRERNNNYINKNYKPVSNNQSSQSVGTDGQDRTDNTLQEIEAYRELIKEHIDYDSFKLAHTADLELIDAIIAIMVDVLVSDSVYVTVAGENKPRELVKNVLLQLNYSDIEHVIVQFQKQTAPIKKKKQYLLSMLYNSPQERKAHYTNLVISDMWNGGGANE